MPKLRDAAKILEKMLPSGLKDAELIAAREAMTPEQTSRYMKALNDAHGPKADRAKNMGFGDETFYHGTNKDIKTFDPELSVNSKNGGSGGRFGKGTYFANFPELPNAYADKAGGSVMPVKLKLGNSLEPRSDIPEALKKFNTNDSSKVDGVLREMNREIGPDESNKALKKAGYDSVYEKTYGEAKVPDAEQIRSTNAAFDPRYKDSKYIMAAGAPVAAMTAGADSPLTADKVKAYLSNPVEAAKAVAAKMRGAYADMDQANNEFKDRVVKRTTSGALPGSPEYAKAADDYDFNNEMSQGAAMSVGSIGKVPQALEAGASAVGKIAEMAKAGVTHSASDAAAVNKATGLILPVVEKPSGFGKVTVVDDIAKKMRMP